MYVVVVIGRNVQLCLSKEKNKWLCSKHKTFRCCMFYGHNRMSSIKFTCTNSAQSDFAYSIGLSHKRCLSTTYTLLERELVQPVVYIFCWRISHCLSFFVETVRRYQTCEHCKNIWQFRASSYNSNKLTNQMQQFYNFIT